MAMHPLLQLFKQNPRGGRRAKRPTSSRLRLESLEQRTLLSVSPTSLSALNPPVAYEIIAPEQTNVGASSNFQVIALDASGQRDYFYNGTASLAETGATTSSSLPTDLKFHFGEADFQATFTGAGVGTFTATETDTVNATPITGSGATTVNPATTATQFLLLMPAHETAGKAVNVVVEALDAAGHIVPNYTGTVTLASSTDSTATLPGSYQFTAADAGKHTFKVTFDAGGQQTVTAADDSLPQLTGSVSTNLTSPQTVTHLGVVVPENIQQGASVQIVVSALNDNNQPVRSYTGTVTFAAAGTSTTASLTLPSAYTFTTGHWWSGDNGRHRFQITGNETGLQSFVVTDDQGNTSPTVTTNVYAAPTVASLRIIAPPVMIEGVPAPVKVLALDASNHVVKVFTDTVELSGGTATVTGPKSPNSSQGTLLYKVTAPTGSAGTSLTLTATDSTANISATATVNVIATHGHGRGLGGGGIFSGLLGLFGSSGFNWRF